MGKKIEFTGNYTDHSTNHGFQFEFHCQRCHAGYRSTFQASAVGTISTVLDTASSLLGGVFGKAADLGNRARSVTWEKAHDDAFIKAYEEIKPEFIQCPRCSSWVCRKGCWNEEKGLCKRCAPDLGVEMAAAQASRTVEEIWAHSKVAEEDRAMLKEEKWREGRRATCPACGKTLKDASKFCPECGAEVLAKKHCSQCGAKLAENAKFCSGCGAKV
ncbi:MAG TPA: zinc ribbon domain-containing protein [Deltaproteobacteria bacterium]|nr:zinc ribbon domain-containing protein [Deltaproteobacteria bacterium]HOI05723.1 zinc ribbon domain-containing protein [Deltaproteobacteria bacterium]